MNQELWLDKAKQLYRIQIARRELEDIEDRLKNELKELSNDESFSFNGYKFEYNWRKGCINYRAIPMLKGVNLDLFRMPEVKTWKLTFEPQD